VSRRALLAAGLFSLGLVGCARDAPGARARDVGGGSPHADPAIVDVGLVQDGALGARDAGDAVAAASDLATSASDAATLDLAPPAFDLAGMSSAHALCVATINALRATEGRAPLARWQVAEPCVDDQARTEAETGIAHSSFPRCGEAAQNLCPGFPGATAEQAVEFCLPAMWAEGPGADYNLHGHYLNMASPYFTKVACGFHRDATGALWFVSDFR
jgi:hypothetical protein